ncbi:MAG: carboxyl transferase domain-containing protein, partial [Bacteroidota bacterium]
AQIAVMGGAQAAKTLVQIQTSTLKAQGKEPSPDEEAELLRTIQQRYETQMSPYYAASRLWVDAVIDPLDTRKWISMGIQAANHAPIEKQFNVGIIQT